MQPEAGLQSRHLSHCTSQWLLAEGRPNVQHYLLLDPAHATQGFQQGPEATTIG